MPTMRPSRRSAGFAAEQANPMEAVGTPLGLEERVQNALETVRNLEAFRPRTYPERPEMLTYDDNQLYEAYQNHESGKVAKAAAEQLRYFAAWRSAVWKVEGYSEGNLIALAKAVHNLELNGEHYDEVKRLRDFIRQHYRCSLPDPVPGLHSAVERWAVRFAQNRRALPLHLRTMAKPPIGLGGRKSGETQQYMTYGDDPDEPNF